MANPGLSDYFGDDVMLITSDTTISTDATDPALVIRLSNFTAEGLSTPANFADPDKLLTAIIKKVQAWVATDTSEDPGTDITTPTKSFTTRNSTQVISWLYYISFFTPDTTAPAPDPDEVGETASS